MESKIDKYEIVKVLGSGGMGTVYLCRDPELDRMVAIKVLNDPTNPDFLKSLTLRFVREALATAQLQHPGIPPVYEVSRDSRSHLYYVMKTIDGRSLSDILEGLRGNDRALQDEFDLYRLISVLCGVCRTVEYAHSRGYIHRDLKPSNIFVGDYGEVYVIDWGLTKLIKSSMPEDNPERFPKLASKLNLRQAAPSAGAEEIPPAEQQTVMMETDKTVVIEDPVSSEAPTIEKTFVMDKTLDLSETQPLPVREESRKNERSADLTMQGKVLGTLAYMSPEQALGENEQLGIESDIYALGVILYEMLTLELPIMEQEFRRAVEFKVKGIFEAPEYRAKKRVVPPELSKMAMQSMSPSPAARPKSVKEFLQALEFWLEGKPQPSVIDIDLSSLDAFFGFPQSEVLPWGVTEGRKLSALPRSEEKPSWIFFKEEFVGDLKVSFEFKAMPLDEDRNDVSGICFVLNADLPDGQGQQPDAYYIHIGASGNTRAYISKNDMEIISNEYVTIEPGQTHKVSVERSNNRISVVLDEYLILFHQENYPLNGTYLGFMHCGEKISFSNIRVALKGLPVKISVIEVPEALMEEASYQEAYKRFIAIANGHRTRYMGAWARYRAGIALYMQSKDAAAALNIWRPLRDTPYAVLEKLGVARLAIENDLWLDAAKQLWPLVYDSSTPLIYMEAVADMVFSQAQIWLRYKDQGEDEWAIINEWVCLSLAFAAKLDKKHSIIPSILWRWLLLALNSYPQYVPDCIFFLRRTFSSEDKQFAKVLLAVEPLIALILRSSSSSNNFSTAEKLTRLILFSNDVIGDCEILFRFYLNLGQLKTARKLALHVRLLALDNNLKIPASVISFLVFDAWLEKRSDFKILAHEMIDKSAEKWAVADAFLLLGLECYRGNDFYKSEKLWDSVSSNSEFISIRRNLIAEGLMGRLPADPAKANIPNLNSLRIIYCVFLGLRYFLDWERVKLPIHQNAAVKLFNKAGELINPSYDIYSDITRFLLAPALNISIPRASSALEELSQIEESWIDNIIKASSGIQIAAMPSSSGISSIQKVF